MNNKSQVQKIYWEFSRIFMVQHRNLFQDSNIPKSYLTQIRGLSWHKNEIKMIRRCYYSSNNFQDSNKRKKLKVKTLGYPPRVFFFNVFELGAESANQVISKEALRSTAEVFFFLGNGAKKFFAVAVCDSVNHRPVGNPKRKVWWVQQRVFPQ
jgi:hypothetical protein